MTTVSCKISQKLAAKLESIARQERRPKSALIREALEQRVSGAARIQAHQSFDSIKHLSGCLSGPTDLSTNPQHLKGFGE